MTATPRHFPPVLLAPGSSRPTSERRLDIRRRRVDLLRTLLSGRRGEGDRRARARRASLRLQVEVECEERLAQSRFFRVTSDLSTFGYASRQGPAHPSGTRLTVKFYLPDSSGRPLALPARVIGAFDETGGVRARFYDPPVESIRRINRFLLERSELTRSFEATLPAVKVDR